MSEPTNTYGNLRSGRDYHLQVVNNETGNSVNMATPANIPLKHFDSVSDTPNLWLKNFEAWCRHRKTEGDDRATVFPLFLDSKAQAWFYGLEEAVRGQYAQVKDAFLKRWDSTATHRWHILDKYLSATQKPNEKVLDGDIIPM